MVDEKIKVIVVTGPTATGKTALAVKLAREFEGEIISADSRQVYTGLDLGTGKDLEEYIEGGYPVKYHLIDILPANEVYNLKQFNIDSKIYIEKIHKNKRLPIIAGGTVAYIDSLLSNYNFPLPPPNDELRKILNAKSTDEISGYIKTNFPEIYEHIDHKNSRPRLIRYYEKILSEKNSCDESREIKQKNNYEWLILGTYFPRKEVHHRIEERLKARLEKGMIHEVENLYESGVSWERLDSFGLEYRYIAQFLQKKLTYEEMFQVLLAKIRKLARTQDIWFRKLENKGFNIYWLEKENLAIASDLAEKFLSNQRLPEPTIHLKNIYYGPKSKK